MPGLVPHPNRKWVYNAPHLTANIKQEMCAEFDTALARLIDATEEFFQAGFQIEYLRDNIDELRCDDPERYNNLQVTGSFALSDRVELGNDRRLTDQILELQHELAELRGQLVSGKVRLASPDLEDRPDNDEPHRLLTVRAVILAYPRADGQDSGS